MTAQEYEQFLFPNLTFCIFAENGSCYMDIHEIINKIYPIPETSMDKLTKHLSKVTYPKGHHILEAGKTETNIFFIEKGIVRAYIPVDGKEVTFWIGKEGSAIVSLKSYVDNQQGYESMELMEESELYLLKRKDLQELFKEDIHIANWGRKFAESEFMQTEERLISGVIAENAVGMSCFLSGNNSGKFEPDQGKAEADALKKLIKRITSSKQTENDIFAI